MRPSSQGLLFLPHIFARKGIYYYRADIPSDLQQYFPTTEIKQSLKTRDIQTAKVMAVSMEYKVHKTFTLIRTDMLSDDIIKSMVAELYPGRKVVELEEVMLSVLVAEYIKANDARWTSKTKMEIMGCNRLIQDIIGNVDVKAISKQAVVDFKDKLLRLPANMYKIYPEKTIQQILDLSNITPMSTTSVNKHILRLNALLIYAVKEGIITTNYAQGMMIPEKRRSDEERKAYSAGDVRKIVEALPRDPGKPERFWIPLIACWTGLRLDEICQLYVEDVQQVDDVWCISVNDEKDKKVKTLSGKRIVPVHPVLLECGLIEFVEGLKCQGVPRLWMNLNWREADGYSNAFGKWYQRFNREYVSSDAQKTFHSFRHTVANTLKQAGIQEVVIAEVMGHTNNSMSMSRYGKRYEPKVLLEALMQLDYGVELPVWKI